MTPNDSAAWSEVRDTNGWSDEFLDSEEFATQLEADEKDANTLLTELGLA